MPIFSVIIPAYNPGELLERSLSSVLSQTLTDLEVVVVDDGSAVAPSWVADRDPRVRYLRQENRGVSTARNVGARSARSELIAFLDQDDEWHPAKLEMQLDLINREPDAGLWCTDFNWVRSEGEPAATQDVDPPTYLGLLSDQMVLLSSVVVRAADYWAVGGHNPMFPQMQDWDLFLRLTMEGREPAMVDTALVDYHLHGENASADYWTACAERFALLAEHHRRARRRGDVAALDAVSRGRERTRELFAYQAVDATRAALRSHDVQDVARHLARAGRLSPRIALNSTLQAVMTRVRPDRHD